MYIVITQYTFFIEKKGTSMDYLIVFLEGIATFISPCLLPMIPIYISYFSCQGTEEKKYKVILNTIGFILGFSIVFILLGILASTLGRFITSYLPIINILLGIVIILFGLNFIEIIHLPFFNQAKGLKLNKKQTGFFSAMLFGIIFSISWTPCVGTFLGSALLLVASGTDFLKGILLLICYCIGLGIPFIISAVLLEKVKNSFDFIKKHYSTINKVCGIFLILIGILMATGLLQKLLAVLS